ncbi:MAG: hypothetical protein IKT68_00750 [Clostridia bacterium]|nr:hypothetical protein [Clostridia bacterium]
MPETCDNCSVCDGDPFECLKTSYENMKKWGYR